MTLNDDSLMIVMDMDQKVKRLIVTQYDRLEMLIVAAK